jgi:antirestriction protein
MCIQQYQPCVFIGTPLNPACGEWVMLPQDSETLEAIRKGIAGDGDYIISDMADLPGVSEYAALDEVNEYAEWLVDEEPEKDVIEALLDSGISFDELPQKYKEGDYFVVDGYTEEDLGESYIEDIGGVEAALSPDKIACYFDYEKFGRDLCVDGFRQYGSHWVNVI